jgi:hypothetical protein
MNYPALFLGFLLLLLCGTGYAGAYAGEDYTKILVLHMNISKDAIREDSVDMQYGHPPNIGLQSGDIRGALKADDGATIKEFDLWDPRIQVGDVIFMNGTNESVAGTVRRTDFADFTLVMPYYQDQMSLDLTDKRTGKKLSSTNFSTAIGRFRETYPQDPGMETRTFHLPFEESPASLLVGGVAATLLTILAISMTRKRLRKR